MNTKAASSSVISLHLFPNRLVSSCDYLLNFTPQGELQVWSEFFRNLSQNIESKLHAVSISWRPRTIAVLFFLLGVVGASIVQGEVFSLWSGHIRPWLIFSNNITNIVLIIMNLGWLLFLVSFVFLLGIYGASRRRIGQLEIITQEKETYRDNVFQLNTQVNPTYRSAYAVKRNSNTLESGLRL